MLRLLLVAALLGYLAASLACFLFASPADVLALKPFMVPAGWFLLGCWIVSVGSGLEEEDQ